MSGMPEMSEALAQKPHGSKVVAVLMRIFKKLFAIGMVWFGIWWLSGLFAMTACTAPQPQPESGRTFHIIMQAKLLHCDGYVKPWVGHAYHFIETVGLIVVIGFVVLTIAMLIARSITGEWPEPRKTKT